MREARGVSRTGSTVANCLIVSNCAAVDGGGVYQALVLNSVLKGNAAVGNTMPTSSGYGGGAGLATLYNCASTVISPFCKEAAHPHA